MSLHAKTYGIIVGADGSPASNAAVCWAAQEAVLRHLPLTLVHVTNPAITVWPHSPLPDGVGVWRKNEGHRILEDALKLARDATKGDPLIPVESELIISATAPTLIDQSQKAELMVVGNSGRGALARGLLGSVSSGLLRQAHCPVAVIREEEPKTPHPAQAPVLVGIDGSPASELATAIAFDEASRRRVNLVAVHAWSDTEIFELPGLDWTAVKAEEERLLAEGL